MSRSVTRSDDSCLNNYLLSAADLTPPEPSVQATLLRRAAVRPLFGPRFLRPFRQKDVETVCRGAFSGLVAGGPKGSGNSRQTPPA